MTYPVQTRLALVLNGGVSLAVWMGGVTHELDLLVRASRAALEGTQEEVAEEDKAVFELWRGVLREANAKVLVDVIAGTSAGGLNGAFLAAAIGRGSPPPNLRQTWKDAAALTKEALLKAPPVNSVLDGDYFERTIGKVLDGMVPDVKKAKPVTLFVTATALDGLPGDYSDGFDDRFEVADHRRIYRWQHDPQAVTYQDTSTGWRYTPQERSEFLEPLSYAALKLAARASAGFPVAFAPVDETALLAQRMRPNPQLPGRRGGRASCAIDGGVLNNAPFGPVLEAIADRQVEGPVRRVVVYVVPSSGLRPREAVTPPPCSATEWPTVLRTAMQYPREADFRTGVAELVGRMRADFQNRQHELFAAQLYDNHETGETKEAKASEIQANAAALFPEYRNGRIIEAVWKAREVCDQARGVEVIAGIPQEKAADVLKSGPEPIWVPSTVAVLTSPSVRPWSWGIRTAERLVWLLVKDLENRLRDEPAIERPPVYDTEAAQGSLSKALGDLSRCARVVRAMEEAVFNQLRAIDTSERVSGRQLASAGVATQINTVYEKLDIVKGLSEQVERAITVYTNARAEAHRSDPAQPAAPNSDETLRACLAAEVLARAFAPVGQLGEYAAEFEFLRLGPDEYSPVFALDQYAELGDRKLYGIRLGHFGAFADAKWRASDFTWGRLDSSHHLLRLFITDHQQRRKKEQELHEAILAVEISREQMCRNLKELAEPDDSRLLKSFLATREGKETARGVLEAALRLLLGSGSPVRGPWTQMLWAAVARRVRGAENLRPSRLVTLLGRHWWWRRMVRNPAGAIGTVVLSGVLTVVSALVLAIGVTCLLDIWVSSAIWSAVIAVVAVPVVLAVELGCTWVAERVS